MISLALSKLEKRLGEQENGMFLISNESFNDGPMPTKNLCASLTVSKISPLNRVMILT